jgi:catechol 2,3-dioxygenase-like lactoylglutathione lyase family enzyme
MDDRTTVKPESLDRYGDWRNAIVRPRRIGHISFTSPDLDKEIDYYTEVNGLVLAAREKDRAFFASKTGVLTARVDKGDRAACTTLSFEVAPDCDFADVSRRLAAEGITSELRNDAVPSIGQVLTFGDNKGTAIELFKDWGYLGSHHQVLGVGPLKLGHVAFVATDVQATARFYQQIMGFRVSDWIDDFFVFMRCNPDHHTVNFIKGTVNKLHHYAFELKDFAHMQNACELFAHRDIPIIWGPVRHGPGHNIATYHRNPDDLVCEFYIELDQLKDEDLGYFDPKPWHRDTPQRPRVWERTTTTIWGPPPLPDFHRARDADSPFLGARAST